MEEKKRLTRSNNRGCLCRSCGILGYRSDDRTDRMGIDGSFRRIRYTALHYIMVNNA